ncbi:MAG: hypothetical protein JW734_09320 [Candidatus Omnitrophica bacterium]|nr:hypothetical protein [Candidatus Omnitrophota bacterium]
MKFAVKIWKDMLAIFKKNPKVFVPFIILGGLNAVLLYVLYLVPQRPVSVVLAPPIRAFFGQRFLQYPLNIFLLPRLFNYAHLFLSASVGILMTGLIIGMLKDVQAGRNPKVLVNLVNSLRRFLTMLGIWTVVFLLSFSVTKLTGMLNLGSKFSLAMSIFTYIVIIFIQIIFIYSMPAVIIEGKNVFTALKRGILFFKRFMFPTFLLTMIPSLLYIPVIILKQNLVGLVNKSYPEAVILVMSAGIFVTFIIDIFFTAAPTIVFLNEKEKGI